MSAIRRARSLLEVHVHRSTYMFTIGCTCPPFNAHVHHSIKTRGAKEVKERPPDAPTDIKPDVPPGFGHGCRGPLPLSAPPTEMVIPPPIFVQYLAAFKRPVLCAASWCMIEHCQLTTWPALALVFKDYTEDIRGLPLLLLLLLLLPLLACWFAVRKRASMARSTRVGLEDCITGVECRL
ncbi:hypothetical protein KM043_015035 [Ampulex compressa]|nr:hypothetical protein KM043_015035 [Ampulex compressa]